MRSDSEKFTPLDYHHSAIMHMGKRDHIAEAEHSRVASVLSSAYKRHGMILEVAIVEQLKLCPRLDVSKVRYFQVPRTADLIVESTIQAPQNIFGTETEYRQGDRTLQVDALVFDRRLDGC